MIVVPTFAYPFSKTIWVAVDRAFLQHLDTNERLDEQIADATLTFCVECALRHSTHVAAVSR